MFDQYMICEEGFQNVEDEGTTGFQLTLRITYYRGLRLSMVEGFEVTVDGESFPREANLFTVGGKTYDYEQMEAEPNGRWEFGEKATLFVPKPGGLASGSHSIAVKQFLRISYMPMAMVGSDQKQLVLKG